MGKAKELADAKYPVIIKQGHVAKHDINLLTRKGFVKGYEQALKGIKEELDKRLNSLWGEIPDASDVEKDNISKEQAFNLGKYNALESFKHFIDILTD